MKTEELIEAKDNILWVNVYSTFFTDFLELSLITATIIYFIYQHMKNKNNIKLSRVIKI